VTTADPIQDRFPELNEWFPPAGPCAFCGHDDKRHRLWDQLIGMNEAGDSVQTIAWQYELPEQAVEAVLRLRPYQPVRRVRKVRKGQG